MVIKYYSEVDNMIITGIDLALFSAISLFGLGCVSLLLDGDSNMTRYSFGGAILMLILFFIQLVIYNV